MGIWEEKQAEIRNLQSAGVMFLAIPHIPGLPYGIIVRYRNEDYLQRGEDWIHAIQNAIMMANAVLSRGKGASLP